MLFVTETVKREDLNKACNFFANFENELNTVEISEKEAPIETPVSKYINTLVCEQYERAIEDIENTKIGNKRMRKRSLQQVMRESFFSGANRFGNNFIA